MRSRLLTSAAALGWTLRLGASLCFIGHGAFGVMTKPAWVPYFGIAGIPPDAAFRWMPVVGSLDILMGCLIVLAPRPAIAAWMTGWAIWTALLRPLTGESPWEALERAGNYGVPLALLLLMARGRAWTEVFAPARFVPMTPTSLHAPRRMLTITVVLLLAGHGLLSIEGKTTFLRNLESVLPGRAGAALPLLGAFELALAAAVALAASPALLVFVALWKMGTEGLFVVAGDSPCEWIERAGSYAAPLALAILHSRSNFSGLSPRDPIR